MVKLAKENVLESQDLMGAYMEALVNEAKINKKIVDVEADLANCINGPMFKEAFPDRFFDIGIAEQSLSTISAGLSAVGKIPFAHSFACFASRRACDQNYISCAYAKNNVKLVGSDPAISAGENGGTHQANEDIAIMRPIADITIIEPSDAAMMKWAVKEAANTEGFFYIRVQRKDNVSIYEEGSTFVVGKANTIREGSDVTLIAEGSTMLITCLEAAKALEKQGISARVVDMFTIKPIDKECIIKCVNETGAIVTAENHTIVGGLGSAVAEVMVEEGALAPMKRIGIPDRFGEVGQPDELQKTMKMTSEDIVAAAKSVISLKK
ncbi:MAG: transketolase family protein [Suipraeoptans sp.]